MLQEWIRNKNEEGSSKTLDWKKKSKYLLVILICLGLLAIIWPVTETAEEPLPAADTKTKTVGSDIKSQMAAELESILSEVEGAGKVSVSLSLASEGSKTYATNVREEKKSTEDSSNGVKKKTSEESITRDLAVNSGSPLLVEECNPKILGVLVVADGAKHPDVREKLTYATSTLLNISAHKVRVMPREGGI